MLNRLFKALLLTALLALSMACSSPKTYTLEEFNKLLADMNDKPKTEVIAVLGTPRESAMAGALEVVRFEKLVKDPATGRIAASTYVTFENGRLAGKTSPSHAFH